MNSQPALNGVLRIWIHITPNYWEKLGPGSLFFYTRATPIYRQRLPPFSSYPSVAACFGAAALIFVACNTSHMTHPHKLKEKFVKKIYYLWNSGLSWEKKNTSEWHLFMVMCRRKTKNGKRLYVQLQSLLTRTQWDGF